MARETRPAGVIEAGAPTAALRVTASCLRRSLEALSPEYLGFGGGAMEGIGLNPKRRASEGLAAKKAIVSDIT